MRYLILVGQIRLDKSFKLKVRYLFSYFLHIKKSRIYVALQIVTQPF